MQKWSLINGTWDLDYTLSEGLGMVADTSADGTTGLVGLTGTVEGGNVVFYATNETVAETDQTYLYTITDSLAATSLPGNESFTLLDTAAPDTLIRGVAFAPTASSTTPVVSTALIVSGGVSSGGLSLTSGGSITVLNGGTIAGTSLLSGGVATISSGGVDSATAVAHGASETVLGSAGLDIIDGTLLVSGATAVVSGEVVENGGSLELFLAGVVASGTTINRNGGLYISGHADALNTLIDAGGLVVLQSPKAELSGSLDFAGSGGVLRETVVVSAVSAGYGDVATISGFGAGDVIDERAFATASLTTTVSGGNVIATLTSGTAAEVFTFAGSAGVSGAAYASGLSSASDNAGGVEIIYTPPAPVDIIVSGGATSGPLSIPAGEEITVLSGGTMSGITVYSGGSAVISAGGEDLSSTILAGGFETVSGDANGDQVYGTQLVTSGPSGASLPATVENETVYNGGTIELYLKPDIATGITVSSGGSLLLSGNVSAVDTTLQGGAFMALQSPKAVISGGLVFSGAATLDITAVTSSGFGGSASLITGWQAGDVIDETLTNPATASLSLTTSGGNTLATITGATYPDVFVFSGTSVAPHIALQDDSDDGVELVYQAACMVRGTLIRTAQGERPIETLQIGALLVTAAGEQRPVRWIGRRELDCTRHPTPQDVWPVLVRRGAFGEGLPVRDLWLSPGHNIAAAGALMPIRALQNGRTVLQVRRPRVEYWHVELDTHDIIFTEGLPSETYLDTGNRCAFVGGGAYLEAHPDFAPKHWTQTCLPLCFDGAEVLRTRAVLRQRAGALGHAVTDDAALHIVADGRRIAPMALGARRLAFLLPEGCENITLDSRCFVPAHVDPLSDDGRTLGVCVGRLQVDGTDIDLADPAGFGAGWHGVEFPSALRWTMGQAALPARARLVVVELAGRGFYWENVFCNDSKEDWGSAPTSLIPNRR